MWGIPVPTPRPQAGSEWRASPKYRWRGFQFSPAVTSEALYVGDRVGFFYALSASDGSPLWDFWAGKGKAVSASPAVIGETVYFPTAQGSLYALDRKDGKLLWELQLESPINVGPVYADGLLFLRTEDGKLHAVE
jgi:outer membrane protein assembly factor BamB